MTTHRDNKIGDFLSEAMYELLNDECKYKKIDYFKEAPCSVSVEQYYERSTVFGCSFLAKFHGKLYRAPCILLSQRTSIDYVTPK